MLNSEVCIMLFHFRSLLIISLAILMMPQLVSVGGRYASADELQRVSEQRSDGWTRAWGNVDLYLARDGLKIPSESFSSIQAAEGHRNGNLVGSGRSSLASALAEAIWRKRVVRRLSSSEPSIVASHHSESGNSAR